MKLVLTSDGFSNKKIFDEFVKLVGKPADEIKIIFIPTAADGAKSFDRNTSKNELIKQGIPKNNIKTLELDHKIKYSEVKDFDVIAVEGGNTYYLLYMVRESGFDKIIKQFVKEDKVYLGFSAGSIITGVDISISLIGGSKNNVNILDFKSLKLVDYNICCHIGRKDKKKIADFEKKTKYELVKLDDGQAIIVVDEKRKLIN